MSSKGLRRINQEIMELANTDGTYHAAPLEHDVFHWHFTIRGTTGDYTDGIYHGRIVLPSDYPFKPPEVYLSTPSGRFEVNKKICLSISSFHPETWQPSWGIKTILVALMAFFDSEPKGAIGSLDAPPAERRRLAKASHDFVCPTCPFVAQSFLPLPAAVDPVPSASTPTPPPTVPAASESTPTPTPAIIPDPTVAVASVSTSTPEPTVAPTLVEPIPPPRIVVSQFSSTLFPSPRPAAVALPAADLIAAGVGGATVDLPVVAAQGVRRPAERPVAMMRAERAFEGGSPLVADRLILAILLALLVLIVQKIA